MGMILSIEVATESPVSCLNICLHPAVATHYAHALYNCARSGYHAAFIAKLDAFFEQ